MSDSAPAAAASKKPVIVIDGARGEGGGQIIRSSLALAAILKGEIGALRVVNIRAKRNNPGLAAQHCVCVLAAAQLGGAKPEGVAVGSTEFTLSFDAPQCSAAAAAAAEPAAVEDKKPQQQQAALEFDIGSAGSTMLVFQTVFPILMFGGAFSSSLSSSSSSSSVALLGGTHNGLSPSTDYVENVFLPALQACGLPAAGFSVEKFGFFPAGGGVVKTTIPAFTLPQQQKDKQPDPAQEEGAAVEAAATAAVEPLLQRVCELPAGSKVVSHDVILLHTRTAEAGNKSTIGASAVADALAEVTARFAGRSGDAAPAMTSKSKKAGVAAAAASAAAFDGVVAPSSITAQEVRRSQGRGWFILQRILFSSPLNSVGNGSSSAAAAMCLGSMEKQQPRMIEDAVAQAAAYLSSFAANGAIYADEYLADQLMLPLALVAHLHARKSGRKKGFVYRAQCLSLHSATNVIVIETFLGPTFTVRALPSREPIDCRAIFLAEDPMSVLPPASQAVEIEICAR